MTCRYGGTGCRHGSFLKKGDAMFWGFLLFTVLAFVFMQLGAMSVWVSILKIGLMLASLVLTVVGAAFLWRKLFN
jgi:hypothetical protein